MRMMLVGAGAVGESMLKVLKWRDPKGEWLSYVLVGDYDGSRAKEVADLLGDQRFSYAQINATDKEQMKELIREHKKEYFLYQNFDNQASMKRWGSQAVVAQTGFGAALAIELIGRGIWREAGVFSPEYFDPEPYLKLMDETGYEWHVIEK